MRLRNLFFLTAIAFAATPQIANSAVIVDSLGNTAPGFADGATPSVLTVLGAQAGQPAPFDVGIGNQPLGPNFSATWTHNYGAIIDTIISATIKIGIYDHNSASPEEPGNPNNAPINQVGLFDIDGTNLIASANTAFEGHGGGVGEYNEYTIALPGSLFTDLADGSATAQLDLTGPLSLPALLGGFADTAFNSAHLIFSTLEITTQGATVQVPEPGTLVLFGIGLAGLGFARRRRAA